MLSQGQLSSGEVHSVETLGQFGGSFQVASEANYLGEEHLDASPGCPRQ